MKLPIYQVDAFTDRVFGGNPACVVPLENWIEDDKLLKISQENSVPETDQLPVLPSPGGTPPAQPPLPPRPGWIYLGPSQ